MSAWSGWNLLVRNRPRNPTDQIERIGKKILYCPQIPGKMFSSREVRQTGMDLKRREKAGCPQADSNGCISDLPATCPRHPLQIANSTGVGIGRAVKSIRPMKEN